MSSTPPVAPAPKRSSSDPLRSYLGIALVLSLIIHLVAGGAFANYKPPKPEKQVVEKVDVTKKIKVVVPTPPPPTPTPPPPTPPPKQTPPPKVVTTAPPPVKKIKLNVVHTHSDKSLSSEHAYVPPPKGDENGIPQGNAASGPPQVVKTGPPSTLPPATATPAPVPSKPSCTVPNQDAAVVNKVDPDYPDQARAVSASGEVKVQVNLTAAGTVSSVSVYQSAGNNSLDQSAMAAARQSTYQPEIVDCLKTAKSYLFVATFDAQ